MTETQLLRDALRLSDALDSGNISRDVLMSAAKTLRGLPPRQKGPSHE